MTLAVIGWIIAAMVGFGSVYWNHHLSQTSKHSMDPTLIELDRIEHRLRNLEPGSPEAGYYSDLIRDQLNILRSKLRYLEREASGSTPRSVLERHLHEFDSDIRKLSRSMRDLDLIEAERNRQHDRMLRELEHSHELSLRQLELKFELERIKIESGDYSDEVERIIAERVRLMLEAAKLREEMDDGGPEHQSETGAEVQPGHEHDASIDELRKAIQSSTSESTKAAENNVTE